MQPLCALYVLERLLHVMTHSRLVNNLASALLLSAPEDSSAPALRRSSPDNRNSMDEPPQDASHMVFKTNCSVPDCTCKAVHS